MPLCFMVYMLRHTLVSFRYIPSRRRMHLTWCVAKLLKHIHKLWLCPVRSWCYDNILADHRCHRPTRCMYVYESARVLSDEVSSCYLLYDGQLLLVCFQLFFNPPL